MQTFLPYPDFARSAAVLDPARLGKQRVETLQILRALELFDYGWSNHPAVGMWRGHTPALVSYGLACVGEWTREPGRRDRASHRGVRATGRRAWPVGVGVRRPDAAVARRRETPSQPPLRPAPQGPGLLPGGVRHDGHPRRPAVPLAGVSCAAAGSARRHRPLGHSCDSAEQHDEFHRRRIVGVGTESGIDVDAAAGDVDGLRELLRERARGRRPGKDLRVLFPVVAGSR